MRSFGIKVPRGGVASTPEEAAKIAADIGKLQRLIPFYWPFIHFLIILVADFRIQ